ncbi:hypothetical protein CMEL01_13228, partial [Colletotrichum melonis]
PFIRIVRQAGRTAVDKDAKTESIEFERNRRNRIARLGHISMRRAGCDAVSQLRKGTERRMIELREENRRKGDSG